MPAPDLIEFASRLKNELVNLRCREAQAVQNLAGASFRLIATQVVERAV